MTIGRPRERVPEKEELIELGKDLVAWALEQDDTNKRMQYCDWYCLKHGFVKKQWELMREKPEFQCYYEQARAIIGNKWVNFNNSSISHRFLRVYCPDVKEDENEKIEFECKTKASFGIDTQNNKSPNEDVITIKIENAKLRGRIEELLNGVQSQASSSSVSSD